jgi:hypothetical protein
MRPWIPTLLVAGVLAGCHAGIGERAANAPATGAEALASPGTAPAVGALPLPPVGTIAAPADETPAASESREEAAMSRPLGAPLRLTPRDGTAIIPVATAMPATPPAPADAAPMPPTPEAAAALAVAGLSADDIRLAQETLAEQGLYRGQLDGKPSVELSEAVRRYQRREGLRETAMLDTATLQRLDEDPPTSGESGAPPPDGARR